MIYFDSLSEVLLMDGHGVYVWVSYLFALGVLLANHFSGRAFLKEELKLLTWSNQKSKEESEAREP